VFFPCVQIGLVDSLCYAAVLLVDPPLREIMTINPKHCPPEIPDGKNLCDDRGTQDHYPEIFQDEYEGQDTSKPSPGLISMYDDMIQCQSRWVPEVNDHPKSCTKFGRKLVIGFWLQFIRRRYRTLLTRSRLGAMKQTTNGYINGTGWLNKQLDFSYEDDIFGNLVSARHKLEAVQLEALANLKALDLHRFENHVPNEKDQDPWENRG